MFENRIFISTMNRIIACIYLKLYYLQYVTISMTTTATTTTTTETTTRTTNIDHNFVPVFSHFLLVLHTRLATRHLHKCKSLSHGLESQTLAHTKLAICRTIYTNSSNIENIHHQLHESRLSRSLAKECFQFFPLLFCTFIYGDWKFYYFLRFSILISQFHAHRWQLQRLLIICIKKGMNLFCFARFVQLIVIYVQYLSLTNRRQYCSKIIGLSYLV